MSFSFSSFVSTFQFLVFNTLSKHLFCISGNTDVMNIPDKNIFANGPKIHDYLRELNENSFGKKKDSITVGEGWPTTKIAIEYTNPEHHELDMMFNFDLISHIWKNNDLEKFEPNIPNLIELKKIFARWQNEQI